MNPFRKNGKNKEYEIFAVETKRNLGKTRSVKLGLDKNPKIYVSLELVPKVGFLG